MGIDPPLAIKVVRHGFHRATIAVLLTLVASSASALDTAFWAWHRSEPLSESEQTELNDLGIKTIYWQIGELENKDEKWRWKSRFPLPHVSVGPLRCIPVIRLESRENAPFSKKSLESLINALNPLPAGVRELQIDYDAPDRLIEEYAAALTKIHTIVPRLSITALPAWGRSSALPVLERSVDELFPMFYDFEPDPVVEGAAPLSLLDPEELGKFLSAWDKCEIPWQAGLPNFSRVTLFERSGKSRGHIRDWNWDDLCFNRSLASLRRTTKGLTVLVARKPMRITNTPVNPDQILSVRWPDRSSLSRVIDRVRQTTAHGIVFFRLPDSTAPSGWSVRQLERLEETPRLVLRKVGNSQLRLVNETNGDLEPRFADPDDQLNPGYALELEAATAMFRDALEGDFFRVTASVGSEGARQVVAVPLASRLTFWFSHLRAHQSLQTGIIQLAPGANFDQIRYRIRNQPSEWRQIVD